MIQARSIFKARLQIHATDLFTSLNIRYIRIRFIVATYCFGLLLWSGVPRKNRQNSSSRRSASSSPCLLLMLSPPEAISVSPKPELLDRRSDVTSTVALFLKTVGLKDRSVTVL